MPRVSINRSISFDPELFSAMEERRERLMMSRSEYLKRLIVSDMTGKAPVTLEEVPKSLVKNPNLRAKVKPRK